MKNLNRTRILSLILVIALAFSLVPNFAFAAEQEPDVSGDKYASEEVLWKYKRQTDVTLQLPSAEYKNVYDIVFVMDSSTSTQNSNLDFASCVIELLDDIKDRNIDLNVGVIKVRGRVFDTIKMASGEAKSGMVLYGEDTKQLITDAINVTEAELKALSSGTNLQGGLKLADEWLTADKAVPDHHKYVFFLTDGKTYIWNDDEDEPTSIYGQYMAKNVVYATPAIGQQTIAYSKSAYRFVDNVNFFSATADELASLSFDAYFEKTGNFYANDFAKLYASENEELGNPTKYDYYCRYADKGSASADGTVTEHDLTNGNYTYNLHKKYYEFTPASNFADLNWMQANPYTVEENDGVYSYTTTVNPDFYQLHPDSLQKALYLTGHLWTDMVAKYNGVAIVYNGWGSGSGLEIAKSFNDWIVSDGISDYGALFTKDASTSSEVEEAFDLVKDNILYMVEDGYVEDIIPEWFTLVDKGAGTFKVTLDGEELPVTYEDGIWNFGEVIGDENGDTYYPYIVHVAEGQENDSIFWTLNVPVENAHPVTLTYTLEIYEEAVEGDYDTNVSAILYYTSTEPDPAPLDDRAVDELSQYVFPVPVVHYREMRDIDVRKVWNDNEDQDGKRPDSVTVELMSGDESFGTAVLNEENEWSATFTDLWKYEEVEWENEIQYEVKELEVEGYESDTDGSMEDGFVITNTHDPERIDITVTKVWDDNDDQDGKRPGSISVNLYADGEKIDDATLDEEGGWETTFTDLYKYEAGKEIEYTVDEEDVEGYEAEIEDFVITNVHEPEKMDVKVTKIWDDNDDQDGLRPDSITISLMNGDEAVAEAELSEENGWATIFEGVDRYAAGEEIEYTVKEIAVDGYETTVSGNTADGYEIVNIHAPEKIDITVTKVWDDEDDKDGKRPDAVTVNLLKGGEKIDSAELSEENGWTATFEGLDKFEAGKEIEYGVEEIEVENYESAVTGSAAEGFVITNTYVPNTGDASRAGGYAALMAASAALYLFLRKKEREG